jgi:hypothetical protein
MVEEMEHQAGAGRTGPAGENTAGDSERNGGDSERNGWEPALADAVGRDVSDGGNHESSSSAGSQGEPAIAPAAPPAPDLPATGEARVDAALKLLERLPGLPVSDHPELFEQVHAQLSEVLGELDSGAGPAGG